MTATLFKQETDRQTLRDYQGISVEKIFEELNQVRSTLLILPTGCGKTTVFSEVTRIVYELGKRVLLLAHREELIYQGIRRIWQFTGIQPGIEMSTQKGSMLDKIVFASVQSMQRKRLERYPQDHFDLIIIDEAHHAEAASYQKIINHFTGAKLLGVTATPDRADEKGLGNTFESIAFQYSLVDAIEAGYLSNIKGRLVKDFDIDLSQLRTRTGKDFTDADLEPIIQEYIAPMAEAITTPETREFKTMVFCPSVRSSEMLSSALQSLGINSAYLSGSHDSIQRKKVLDDFSKGKITHLVNCALFTEGFDEPSIQQIVMARPTKSRSLFAQMVGRGTRLHASKPIDQNGKPYMWLTEFNYTNTKHKLVTAYELFSSKGYEEATREAAAKKNQGATQIDFLASLKEANSERFDVKKLVEKARKREYGFITYDPFAISDLLGIDLTGEIVVKFNGRELLGPATEGQMKVLNRSRIEVPPEGFTKSQASILIDQLAKNGWRTEQILINAESQIMKERGF